LIDFSNSGIGDTSLSKTFLVKMAYSLINQRISKYYFGSEPLNLEEF